MVLMATQQLLKLGAEMRSIDLDEESADFKKPTSCEQALCLDGLWYFCLASDLRPWLERQLGRPVRRDALHIALGLDGKPTGRAIVDFGCHDVALQAYSAFTFGRVMVAGRPDEWPNEEPKERLILARPLRLQERMLLDVPRSAEGQGPRIAPFPDDARALSALLGRRDRPEAPKPAQNCSGVVKNWGAEKTFGFLSCQAGGDVFVHRNDCPDGEPLSEGQAVLFDIVEDQRSGKVRAANI